MKRLYDYKGMLTLRKIMISVLESQLLKKMFWLKSMETHSSLPREVMEYLLGDESPLFKELEREKVI